VRRPVPVEPGAREAGDGALRFAGVGGELGHFCCFLLLLFWRYFYEFLSELVTVAVVSS
jgi:hypothetical protein